MALIKCSECGHGISTKAATCPNCGAPVKPAKAKKSGCLGCLTMLLILVGLFMWVNQKRTEYDNTPEGRAAATQKAAQDAADQKTRAAQAEADQKATNEAAAKLRKDATVFDVDRVVSFYAANEVAGDEQLKGKVFKVEGDVDRVAKDVLNQPYVVFKAGGPMAFRSVQCFFSDAHQSELRSLVPGQHIIVFGTCKGLMMNVIMDDCELSDK